MKKKIVIFDLDGTLLNTLADLTDSTNYALNYFGYPLKTLDQVKSYVGNGVYKLIERAVPQGKDDENFSECLNIFKKNYKENMYNKIEVYSGIKELLWELKNKDIKIAVVSNKFDSAVKELCDKIFPNLIDLSLGENESNGIKKKPSADMVEKVIQEFSFEKDDCLYVGDSEVDIETAFNAGVDCLSVSWGFKSTEFLKEHGAKIIINSPDEILKYL